MCVALSRVAAQSPKQPPPPPICPDCCPTDYSSVATHTYTANNPKTGASVPVTVGERGEVDILFGSPAQVVDGLTLCFQYSVGELNKWSFYASGGGDSDICVKSDDSNSWGAYGATHKYSFTGAPGTPSCSTFEFEPPFPETGCDTYTLIAKAEEGTDENCVEDNPDCPIGRCNASDPPKESEEVTLKVWRCKLKSETNTGTIMGYVPLEGCGIYVVPATATSVYWDCNGAISTHSQKASVAPGSYCSGNQIYFGAQNRFNTSTTNGSWNPMMLCGTSTSENCSAAVESFTYGQASSGVSNEFDWDIIKVVSGGQATMGTASGNISVSLPTSKCCP